MATGRPDTVEEWAPIFYFFAGTTERKFSEEQICDPAQMISNNHCKLCDCPVTGGSYKEHMKAHRRELTAWLAKRRKEGAKKSAAGLETARREKQLLTAHDEEED